MKVRPKHRDNGEVVGYEFYCPGCKTFHYFNTGGEGPIWGYNGDPIKPTFSPSLLRVRDWPGMEFERRCHLFVINGEIRYLKDCFHHMAGKTVEMVNIEELT